MQASTMVVTEEDGGHNLQGVRFLRLLWCNGAGLRCCRVVPLSKDTTERKEQLRRLAAFSGPALTRAAMCLPSWGDVPAAGSGFGPVGDICLQLEPSSIRVLPWHPSHAIAQVTMYDPGQHDTWSVCPRGMLARVLNRAKDKMGLSFRAGFELEFTLVNTTDNKPVDTKTYCSASAFDAVAPLLDEVTEVVEKMGLTVEQLHAESGPGQFEVVFGHEEVMEAADQILMAKEAIIAVAHRRGLRVIFLPKYKADQAGHGMHVHLSLWREGVNLLQLPPHLVLTEPEYVQEVVEQNLDGTVAHFLAGVLHYLPSLLCFTTPTPNSFRRLQPGCWAGAYQIWGFGNKEAPIRLPMQPPESGFLTNAEFKMLDSTANPHIALAAIIASGLIGLEHQMPLPMPVQVDPGTLSSDQREALGIKNLPTSFSEATMDLLSPEGQRLRDALGEEAVQCLLAVRRSEEQILGGLDLEAEVALLAGRY